ncbi:MAG: 2-oxoacid:acceptor oxidoreductase subunit alpha [Bacillota bacterium]
MKRAQLMQGNEAVAYGAIAAGCRFFAGYPITPSTEVAEIMAELLPRHGGKFIQMEDEIASMAAVIGASLTGAKSMTATSGPGFSLKQENLGFAALTEVPCVVVNVQRGGPSTGLPTSPAQADVMQARWGTHGDHPIVALTPSSVRECFDLTIEAFNISEELRVPVILLLDEVIGHMREKVVLPEGGQVELVERPRPTVGPEEYRPYDDRSGDVPPMADFGSGYRWHVTGLMHDATGFPVGPGKVTEALIRRVTGKVDSRVEELNIYEEENLDDAEIAVVAYGSTARTALRAARQAREQGLKVGVLRLMTIWPFPDHLIKRVADQTKRIIVSEMNLGQLVREVERAAGGRAKVEHLGRVDGELITPDQILAVIKEA